MPFAFGLVALLVLSVGGALFLSTRPDHVPGHAENEIPAAAPSPVMTPASVRLLAMAHYLESRKRAAATPTRDAVDAPADSAETLRQDVEILTSVSTHPTGNASSLDEVQQRMQAAPEQYFEAFQASFPSIPLEAFQVRLSSAQWIVSLAQTTHRQAEAEPLIRQQLENAQSEAEEVAYKSLLATLGYAPPERAPAKTPPKN